MANAKISDLPPVTAIAGGDLAVVVQGGVTSQTSIDDVFTDRTLVDPLLGTPVSGDLTNCTDLPIVNGTTGTLSVARGGTGITAFGTGVATALGINTGSAGAVVVLDGALGTPTSGTVTNLTGTASININGTVGATTPTTGAFTTATATSSSSTAAEAAATRGMFSQLTLSGGFGSSNPIAPSSGQGVQGRVAGSNLSSTATYYAGTLGQYKITGTNSSTFPKVGLLGVVGDATTTGDSAVMAWMDGDTGTTTARAGYGIGMTQSTGASGFEYGMDLNLQDAVGGGGSVQPYKKAELRVSNNVVVMTGAGAPSDGTTGDDFAGPGSMYVDITGANLYIQTGLITSPVWKLVTRAA
jgi:hypothetical protein